MIFAAILAGGVGSRMNISDAPKQFLPLNEKPIIIHTLEKFLMCRRFDVIYMGVHQDWILYTEDLLKSLGLYDENKIKIVAGGQDRNSTMFNIIDDIEKSRQLQDNDVIVTHDSVRPFVTIRMIEESIDAAIKYGACDTVVPATDTIVSSKDGVTIDTIPERWQLYQGQTPQSFKINLLKQNYYSLSEEEKNGLTDACNIFVKRGQQVHLIKGDVSNMKLTTVSDYKIAKSLVGGKKVD